MTIKTPREMVYYQASPNEPDQLFCWIPFKNLKKMVDHNKADKKILTDYPDGLDIEISDEEFRDFENKYQLKLEKEPRSIRLAYEYLRKEKLIKTPGYIRGKALDELSKKIPRPDLEEIKKIPRFDAKAILKKKRTLSAEFSKKLNEMKSKPAVRSGGWISEKELLFKVRMTKGKEPFDVLYKLQRRGRVGK